MLQLLQRFFQPEKIEDYTCEFCHNKPHRPPRVRTAGSDGSDSDDSGDAALADFEHEHVNNMYASTLRFTAFICYPRCAQRVAPNSHWCAGVRWVGGGDRRGCNHPAGVGTGAAIVMSQRQAYPARGIASATTDPAAEALRADFGCGDCLRYGRA